MNSHLSEVAAAWIVAAALVAAVAAHAFLPATPPRLEPGVMAPAAAARVGAPAPDHDLPLGESPEGLATPARGGSDISLEHPRATRG